MASSLGQIFTFKPRYAENADARFDIRRQDPDQERRREEDEPEKKITFNTYDNTVVSVDALRIFLENFLKSIMPGEESPARFNLDGATMRTSGEFQEKPVSAQASRAASLYQSAAKTAPRSAPPAPEFGQAASAPKTPELPSEDVRTIHRLLLDISALQARRIEFLTIEKGETFLASLSLAVAKVLNS